MMRIAAAIKGVRILLDSTAPSQGGVRFDIYSSVALRNPPRFGEEEAEIINQRIGTLNNYVRRASSRSVSRGPDTAHRV